MKQAHRSARRRRRRIPMRSNPDAEGNLRLQERYVVEIAEAGAVWTRKMLDAVERGGERAVPRLVAITARMIAAMARAHVAGARRQAAADLASYPDAPDDRARVEGFRARHEDAAREAWGVAERLDREAKELDAHEHRGFRALHPDRFRVDAAEGPLRRALAGFREAIASANTGDHQAGGGSAFRAIGEIVSALKRAGLPQTAESLSGAVDTAEITGWL